jgi:hypothetical protein
LYALKGKETLRKVVVAKRGSLLPKAETTGGSTANALEGRVSLREDVFLLTERHKRERAVDRGVAERHAGWIQAIRNPGSFSNTLKGAETS